ncbi:AAA ATPase domain-containing protein [Tieghemostelium lacteum]|uniref:AAA ATPase domain-containing protein n=1 Tax=Tieghemostelium lacteum TaxID=361077 RepID=A0A152A2M4_TIELA|nr:AAA ATPase domain-containing protein [Tieghemostelium lacteum]|eukprot:KYR00459.1 AAA ATPase domain-containing protein [Tieghemostelium lacteum]
MLGNKRQLSPLKNNDEDEEERESSRFSTQKKIKLDAIDREILKANQSQRLDDESLERALIKESLFSVSSFSGKKVQRRMKIQEDYNDYMIPSHQSRNQNKPGSLIGKTIPDLLEEIYNDELNKKQFNLLRQQQQQQQQSNNKKSVSTVDYNRLWVDKYAPSTFHELLSDDRMNIDILNWLKQWDPIVFKRPLLVKKSIPTPTPTTNPSSNTKSTYNYTFQSKTNSNNNSNNSSAVGGGGIHDFPKIILMTGGPGIGKTTLAHILAKQAGYQPFEINASDDRSGESFETKLLSTIEMQSVIKDSKPKCLIIDEIDGISGRDNGPIELLLKILNSSAINNKQQQPKTDGKSLKSKDSDDEGGEDEDETDSTNKGSKKKVTLLNSTKLQRPIICICNDQYAPSLRKLRKKALVFNFAPPKKTRLLSRLKEICQKEGLQASDTTLNSLIDITNSDIRASINSLQFIKSRYSSFDSNILSQQKSSIIGQKDIERGLVEILKNIFQSNRVGSSGGTSTNANHIKIFQENFEKLKHQLNSSNQIDKIMEGIYENYLQNMTGDFNFQRIEKSLEWIGFFDCLDQFHDDKFKTVAALAIHFQCNAYQAKVQIPHSDYDAYIKKKSNQSIVDSVFTDHNAYLRSSMTKQAFYNEVVYPLNDILALPVRPVNTQLYSQYEKSNLNNLIDTMDIMDISYLYEESTYQYKLEPPIDLFLNFIVNPKPFNTYQNPNQPDTQNQEEHIVKHLKLTNNQKKIISETLGIHKSKSKSNIPKAPAKEKPVFKMPTPINNALTPPKQLPVLKDFFGRVIQNTSPEKQDTNTTSNSSSSSSTTNTSTFSSNIKYRYQEGFTNAIKKVVYVKDFL